MLRLLRRYLQAGIMIDGVVSPRQEGNPQGSPISPLLSNILLDVLDNELEKRGHKFVRYADDCNIYVKSKESSQRVMDSITRFLSKKLRLKVNKDKSRIDRPWKLKYLGYSVTSGKKRKQKPAPQSINRLKKSLRNTFREGRGRSVEWIVEEINKKLRGWVN